jgi:hypothetical protein
MTAFAITRGTIDWWIEVHQNLNRWGIEGLTPPEIEQGRCAYGEGQQAIDCARAIRQGRYGGRGQREAAE